MGPSSLRESCWLLTLLTSSTHAPGMLINLAYLYLRTKYMQGPLPGLDHVHRQGFHIQGASLHHGLSRVHSGTQVSGDRANCYPPSREGGRGQWQL